MRAFILSTVAIMSCPVACKPRNYNGDNGSQTQNAVPQKFELLRGHSIKTKREAKIWNEAYIPDVTNPTPLCLINNNAHNVACYFAIYNGPADNNDEELKKLSVVPAGNTYLIFSETLESTYTAALKFNEKGANVLLRCIPAKGYPGAERKVSKEDVRFCLANPSNVIEFK